MKQLLCAGFVLYAAAVSAQPHHVQSTGPGARLQNCHDCATVQSVVQEKRKGNGGAVGIVGGAVVGGLLGNQIGKGTGNTVATVGGAVAGGYAGNEVQKHVNARAMWVTTVKMRDGSIRRFEQDARPGWGSGNVVHVRGQVLSRA
ncbi:glycine zipper 2TM domain-containing protein [Ramlibacter sp.]|uniref:glycine zipper 2TM domain-containing protein n=1 Tax=Ramlibacter sp. TaxID=1917967 RepID=UPI0018130297|nr:glycine zipper 2TM domain-containing protein [Ramlibacter sp.]MBA2676511.1 glycine zipper 2TM domain-containing protein [Ramlibacter sp.]